MMLHLPEGVKFHLRKEPMFPYEVADKGLKRFTGNAVNSHTRRNRELAEKYKESRGSSQGGSARKEQDGQRDTVKEDL